MVMLAHIIYKNIDNQEVATFSKVINQSILRDKFLFKGLILSDDLSMKALSGSIINKVKKPTMQVVMLYFIVKLNLLLE